MQDSVQARPPSTSVVRELATLGPALLVLGGLLTVAVLGDATPGETARSFLAVGLFQVLPGALLWRLLRPVDGWLVEDLAMGLAVGAALTVPFQVASVAIGVGWLAYVFPLALSSVLLGTPRLRSRVLARRWSALPWWWGMSLTAAFAVGVASYLDALRYPVRWVGFAEKYVDRSFHEGLAAEALHRFPLHYPWVASEEVAYHWFSHAWNANIAALAGTPIDVTLWLMTPALVAVAAPLSLAVVAVRLTGLAWSGPLAAIAGYLATALEPWHVDGSVNPLVVESPSQMFAALVYPALLATIALRWKGLLGRGSTWVLLLLLFVAAGTKGTTVSVLIPGLVLAASAGLVFARRQLGVVLTDAGLSVGVFLLTAVMIFGGETKNMRVVLFEWLVRRTSTDLGVEAEPWSADGLSLVALGVLVMMLAVGAVLAALTTRSGRTDPVLWLLAGTTAAGIGALLVFVQVSNSHIYFYKISLVASGLAVAYATAHLTRETETTRPLVVGATAGVGIGSSFAALALARTSPPGPAAAWTAVVVAVAVVALVSLVVLRRRGTRATVLATVIGLVAAAAVGPLVHLVWDYERPHRLVADERVRPYWVGSGEVRVLRWLRDHSDPDDLVVTNRHCRRKDAPDCDSRRFDVAAYSERRVLVEGWAYTPKADAQYDEATKQRWHPFWDTELIETNDRFFTHPDEAGREALLALGVRWLVVSDQAPHARSLEPWAELRAKSPRMKVYELVPDRG